MAGGPERSKVRYFYLIYLVVFSICFFVFSFTVPEGQIHNEGITCSEVVPIVKKKNKI